MLLDNSYPGWFHTVVLAIHLPKQTGVSKTTASRWIKRYMDTRETEDRPRIGHPRCTSEQQAEVCDIFFPRKHNLRYNNNNHSLQPT